MTDEEIKQTQRYNEFRQRLLDKSTNEDLPKWMRDGALELLETVDRIRSRSSPTSDEAQVALAWCKHNGNPHLIFLDEDIHAKEVIIINHTFDKNIISNFWQKILDFIYMIISKSKI